MSAALDGPVLAVTGHRPGDLFGYNMSDPRYAAIRAALKNALIRLRAPELYTGMALGVDQLAAAAAMDADLETGLHIRLHAAVPCRGQDGTWTPASRELYRDILARCDKVTLVTDAPYSPAAMHARNAYMCRQADAVLAVWDPSKRRGGTYSCIQAAKKMGKPVLRIDPFRPEDVELI